MRSPTAKVGECKPSEMLNEVSDEDLLIRIGRHEDVNAYKALYGRFAPRAFCLARHLSCSKDLAEDIVQEAMLSVWTSAPSFDIKRGSASAWILRIVANKAIYLDQKVRKDRKRVERRNGQSTQGAMVENLPELGNGEMQAYLRGLIAGLQPDQRRLVTLYFGAGLSQDEIAKTLSVSQRKISLQIKKVLSYLKSNLTKAGFSVAVGFEPALVAVLASGWKLPPALGSRIFEQLSNRPTVPSASNESTAESLTTPTKMQIPAFSTASFWVLASASLVTLVVVSTTLMNKTEPEILKLETPAPAVSSDIPTPTQTTYWKKTWNLDSIDSMSRLTFLDSAPTFIPDRGWKGSGCVNFPGHSHAPVLTIPLRKLPTKVSFRFKAAKRRPRLLKYHLSVDWQFPIARVAFNGFMKDTIHDEQVWVATHIFVTENSFDTWCQLPGMKEKKRTGVVLAPRKPGSPLILFKYGNLLFDDLTIEEIPKAAVPDLSEFRATFQKYRFTHVPGKLHEIDGLDTFKDDDRPLRMMWYPSGTKFQMRMEEHKEPITE